MHAINLQYCLMQIGFATFFFINKMYIYMYSDIYSTFLKMQNYL